MKTSTRHLKVVALFFSVLILFQGCTVYKSVPISIEQAVQNESKVKIKTNNNKKLKFKRIEFANGIYYGVNKTEQVTVKTPLDENSIDTIKEKNKTLSMIIIIGVVTACFIGGYFIQGAAAFGSF